MGYRHHVSKEKPLINANQRKKQIHLCKIHMKHSCQFFEKMGEESPLNKRANEKCYYCHVEERQSKVLPKN